VTEEIVIGTAAIVLGGIIGGVIKVLSKHVTDDDKHPSKKELKETMVAKEIYDAKHGVILDVLENWQIHQEHIEQNSRSIISINKDLSYLKGQLDEASQRQEIMINLQQEILGVIKKNN